MIYTITFNPSLDYIASCEDFRLGETNRVSKEIIFPGGKGINVSIVLSNFGMDTTALGLLAKANSRKRDPKRDDSDQGRLFPDQCQTEIQGRKRIERHGSSHR